jgi:hypothetical protein
MSQHNPFKENELKMSIEPSLVSERYRDTPEKEVTDDGRSGLTFKL